MPKGVVSNEKRHIFELGGQSFVPGSSALVELPLMRLYTQNQVTLPVKVIVGKRSGPTLFLSGAVHGDEVNGVEIIRRVLSHRALKRLAGVLLAVPVVNVHGLLGLSRYLPDRRDLNRSFPGSEDGSLAARVADRFMKEIVSHCEIGIDFHSGSNHRYNLPHIRAKLDDDQTKALAEAFGAPVILDSDLRDGSLRAAMVALDKRVLVFEGGEPLRFDEFSIRAGVRGALSVLRAVGSLPKSESSSKKIEPFVARSSSWVRAPSSGLFRVVVKLGARVKKGDVLGYIGGPFVDAEIPVRATASGVLLSQSNLPLAHQGEALFHIACFDKLLPVAKSVQVYQQDLNSLAEEEDIDM